VSSVPEQPRPGRVFHPPFTDFPIAAYVFAAAFDLISAIGGPHRDWALQLWHAGTFVLIAGACLCLLTMLTGFADLLRFSGSHPGATGTVITHVAVMAGVFMIGSGDIAWRLSEYHSQASTPMGILIVSIAAAAGVCIGASHGGSLVFRYGVGVQAGAPAPVPVRVNGALMPGQAARHRSRRGK
jgi:uncharacterized membrane protein